jgi:hypothetical protein
MGTNRDYIIQFATPVLRRRRSHLERDRFCVA